MKKLHLDIISDIACPWCIIGYKRLEKALASIDDKINVEIQWHPYELNPQMTDSGQNLREHVIEKYGMTAEQSAAVRENITTLAKELGFEFNYSDDFMVYNTRKAHQLLMWSEQFGKKTELKLGLFKAFFTENQKIDDDEVLANIALTLGLDRDEALNVIRSDTWSQKVALAESEWANAGLRSVPAYVVNRTHLITGAQEPQVLADALLQIADE